MEWLQVDMRVSSRTIRARRSEDARRRPIPRDRIVEDPKDLDEETLEKIEPRETRKVWTPNVMVETNELRLEVGKTYSIVPVSYDHAGNRAQQSRKLSVGTRYSASATVARCLRAL